MAKRRKYRSAESSKESKPATVHVSTSATPSPNDVDVGCLKAWTPTLYTAFKALLSARLCAAVWSNISDCDEVFNYWEPTHFMLYGKGFQTWEYSPLYAIRSYGYILIHALPGFLYSTLLQSNKVLVFYFTRCLLGFLSATCEVYFYGAICQQFGANIGRLTLLLLLMGSGMFIASAAFLPSTFSMYLSTVALGSWFIKKYEVTILATAASVFLGWPFAVILSIPAAYDILINKQSVALFIKWSLVAIGLILIPLVLTDTHYFGKFVIAPLNIVLYNVFTSHGPDLYGTESWTFYFLNGFLNFNVGFVAALLSAPILIAAKYVLTPCRESHTISSYLLYLLPMYIWIMIFFVQSHKEERFLFPIYPLICLAASVAIDGAQRLYAYLISKKNIVVHYLDSTTWMSLSFAIVYVLLCLSRTVLTYRAYRAPIETFMELTKISNDENMHPLPPEYPVNICMGKEWYRFPSSFFLPPNWNLQFLKSEFRGQLPKPYANTANATKIIPSAMNDQNLEEPSRYTSIQYCDYLVDSEFPSDSQFEPNYSLSDEWKLLSSIPFLDASRSSRLLRAFYIPYFTDYKCTYVNYNLLQRVKIRDRLHRKKKKSHNL